MTLISVNNAMAMQLKCASNQPFYLIVNKIFVRSVHFSASFFSYINLACVDHFIIDLKFPHSQNAL